MTVTGKEQTEDGACGAWLLAAHDFGWSSARWLTVRLSLFKEEVVGLIDGDCVVWQARSQGVQ
jgi:hypothetical protein